MQMHRQIYHPNGMLCDVLKQKQLELIYYFLEEHLKKKTNKKTLKLRFKRSKFENDRKLIMISACTVIDDVLNVKWL